MSFNPIQGEKVVDLANNNAGFVARAVDPIFSVAPRTAEDFAAQYPVLLDPTEVIAMCSETSLWRALPDIPTGLKQYAWREMDELEFASGSMSTYLGFADGDCPNPNRHDGDNKSVVLKNIGTIKSITESDLIHSRAVAGYGIGGINALQGPLTAFEGLPGVRDMGDGGRRAVADVKAKEAVLSEILVLNGWDQTLVSGNKDTNPLLFDGVETLVTAGNGAQTNTWESGVDTSASGTFDADAYDRFLAQGCANPTQIWGHPQALQAVASEYFQLGFQGSQLIEFRDGNRVVPGFNFASVINTGVGQLTLVADSNFSRTSLGGSSYQTKLYGMRTYHAGDPLVHKITQIPFQLKDLAPGCTAIQFMLYTKTALVIKHMCAHSVYTTLVAGRIVTSCPRIGV